jgi:hypothetical protein
MAHMEEQTQHLHSIPTASQNAPTEALNAAHHAASSSLIASLELIFFTCRELRNFLVFHTQRREQADIGEGAVSGESDSLAGADRSRSTLK